MYIGIDLGGTNIAAGMVDKAGHIVYKLSVSTLAQRPIEEIAEDICLCYGTYTADKTSDAVLQQFYDAQMGTREWRGVGKNRF